MSEENHEIRNVIIAIYGNDCHMTSIKPSFFYRVRFLHCLQFSNTTHSIRYFFFGVDEIARWGTISIVKFEARIFHLELGRKYDRHGTIAVVPFVSLTALVCVKGLTKTTGHLEKKNNLFIL
jgi:hypothetical protein